MSFKKISVKTKKTLNEAKNLSKSAKSIPIDDLDCLRDFETGECVDPRDSGNSTEAGSTAGSLSVSLTGAASYSIPIMVPPGIKDVAPNIGVSYTSQGANGLAGWGWNVSGLSTISRIPATKYYDNKHDGIDFKDDRFSIDGQRLIIKSGTYGASGSVYQTENYSNVKVVAYGTSPYGSTYGPSYFIVYYPNGTRAWYGNAGNSRSRLEWAIFRWQDPQGNYVDYNYQSDNGLLSIKTIKYGGRIGGTSPTNQINFTYISRNRPENVYVGEYSFKRTNLLRSIQTTASGSQYRKYELTHNTTSLGYQRLTSVKEYNAQNKALRPITFNYETTSSWIPNRNVVNTYPGFDYKTSGLIAGDYDGDGRTDIIYYNKNTRDKLHMNTNLYEETAFAFPINTEKFSDVFSSTILSWNNKILSQQAVTTVRETSSSSSSSTSTVRFRTFAQASYGPVHQYDKVWNTSKYRTDNYCSSSSYYMIPKKYISGDFNGDGLTDVIAIEKSYSRRQCYPVGGDDEIRFDGFRKTEAKKENAKKSNKNITKENSNNQENIQNSIQPIDDVFDNCECNSYTTNQYNAKVHFIDLKRDVTSNFSKTAGYFRKGIGSNDLIQVGDHNGDGKQDIYHFKEGKLYIYTLNESNNLVLLHEETDSGIKLSINNYNTPILMGDYNGDGKTDFIVATANKSKNWRFFISKGKNYYKQTKSLPYGYYQNEKKNIGGFPTPNYTYYEYRYTAQDVNGDGKTDLIMHNVNTTVNYREEKLSSAEYISIYKSNQISSTVTPTFSYETGYTDTSGEVHKYGSPIFLESNVTNGNLEYGYISVNNIFMYEFKKNHRKDVTLKSITNNGVKTTIDYERLGIPENPYGSQVYSSDYNQNYPFVNINRANSFQLVKKLTEEGAGIKRYQDFLYHGAVSNINIGFQGFLKTKRSNWYGNGVGTLWTISKHDVTKKGVATEQWVSTSSYEGSSYMSKTTNTFSTNLTSNKVFTNIPTKVVQHNALSGVTTTKNYTYDGYKNLLTENSTYNGGSKNITYTYSNNASANTQYYHIGRITKKVETNTIGGNTFTSEEAYSYNNNLLTQKKVKGNGTPWNTENITYDAFGNVTRKTLTPSGLAARTENFKYDSSGRFLIESTDIEGLKTKFTYDGFGNPITTINPYGQKTTFTYDGWNRLISEKNYLDKITTFAYTYLNGGGLKKTTNYPQGTDEIAEYNALGWVLKSGALGINNKWTYKSIEYDVAGRKIRESEPYFTSPSQWNTMAFDVYGREITRTSFNGLVANITYNGLVTTVNDGTKTVKTTKDGRGNILKMEDSGGIINYTYFGNGTMKTANYGSHVVSTEIDGWGRKTKLTDPSAGTYTYRYNNLGEVLEETTPKGKTTYTYDGFGKITTKKVSGEETNLSLNYTYNSTTKLLTSIQGNNARTNENYTYTYLYDSYKRPSATKEQNGQASFEYQVARDSYGRVNAETYISKNLENNVSSTIKVRNIFDANSGILTEIQDYNAGTSLWKLKEVNQKGQAKEVLLGNGMVKKRTYDQFGFLTKIVDQTSGNSPKTALNLEYSFNTQRGNLNSRKNHNLGWNESFTYDNLDRLTNISGSVTRSQQYDARGRITSNSEIGTYNYGSASSYRLQNVSLNTKGDLHYQNQPLQNIKYNAYKKPVSIKVKDKAQVDFEYGILQSRSHAYYGGNEDNKLDRRYQKHYSGITPVEIEVDKQGNTKIITYIGGDAYAAPVVHIKQTKAGTANGFHYLHRDYLGSILAISDNGANVIEQRQFGAWGEVDKFKKGNSEIDFKHDTTLLSRGYTGHEHFIGVALIHMNGRMYDAKLGRFLSPDNYIQEPFNTQNFNRYGYVLNNPLKYTDQSGELFIVAALIGALISVTTNGIINLIDGRPFFQGAGLAALTGAIGGVFAKAIGTAVQGLKGILKVGVQAVAHGHLGGMMSLAMGGDYFSGFAAGAVGSAIGHYALKGLESAGASNFWKAAGTITAGSLSGGVGSVITGGKFWDGFRNGAISSSLNHVAHMVKNRLTIKQMLKRAGYAASGKATASLDYVKKMIEKIPELKKIYKQGKTPKIFVESNNRSNPYYHPGGHFVVLTKNVFVNNFRLLSTSFHEFNHAFQYKFVHKGGEYSGKTIAQWAYENIGSLSVGGKGHAYLEANSYHFQMHLGDLDSNTIGNFNKFFNIYNK
ncbi:VCBS repeat-containing protein [Polaribacter batillariae]|uniref:VCBS repeat-containing protein n=1 Tax=Polaribacter batillariae TaxID=2808900 RepID=A0ABX7SQ82_9FLAO|nr:FG-GAP-like repeat-containing protein [Polaribacter batillariae]QTD36385.1 VCBS repeat-containing protein [Polaribacter batillariae]